MASLQFYFNICVGASTQHWRGWFPKSYWTTSPTLQTFRSAAPKERDCWSKKKEWPDSQKRTAFLVRAVWWLPNNLCWWPKKERRSHSCSDKARTRLAVLGRSSCRRFRSQICAPGTTTTTRATFLQRWKQNCNDSVLRTVWWTAPLCRLRRVHCNPLSRHSWQSLLLFRLASSVPVLLSDAFLFALFLLQKRRRSFLSLSQKLGCRFFVRTAPNTLSQPLRANWFRTCN